MSPFSVCSTSCFELCVSLCVQSHDQECVSRSTAGFSVSAVTWWSRCLISVHCKHNVSASSCIRTGHVYVSVSQEVEGHLLSGRLVVWSPAAPVCMPTSLLILNSKLLLWNVNARKRLSLEKKSARVNKACCCISTLSAQVEKHHVRTSPFTSYSGGRRPFSFSLSSLCFPLRRDAHVIKALIHL